jgi:ketosteroid isomerase-like protein
MTQEIAYRFVEALAALEQRGNIERMLDTFAESCEIGNASNPEKFHGKDGAREFWTSYRTAFRDMRSTIRNIITGDDSIALEWTARATDGAGKEFHYDGVSIITVRGHEITRFRAYFDTKKLGERMPPQQAQTSVRDGLTATASAASSATSAASR